MRKSLFPLLGALLMMLFANTELFAQDRIIERAKLADLIATGTILEDNSAEFGVKGQQVLSFKLDQVLKTDGPATGQTVHLVSLTALTGYPTFKVGETGLVFMTRIDASQTQRAGMGEFAYKMIPGKFSVVGLGAVWGADYLSLCKNVSDALALQNETDRNTALKTACLNAALSGSEYLAGIAADALTYTPGARDCLTEEDEGRLLSLFNAMPNSNSRMSVLGSIESSRKAEECDELLPSIVSAAIGDKAGKFDDRLGRSMNWINPDLASDLIAHDFDESDGAKKVRLLKLASVLESDGVIQLLGKAIQDPGNTVKREAFKLAGSLAQHSTDARRAGMAISLLEADGGNSARAELHLAASHAKLEAVRTAAKSALDALPAE